MRHVSSEILDGVRTEVLRLQERLGTLLVCDEASGQHAATLGGEAIMGAYYGPEVQRDRLVPYGHWFVRLPDETIIDLTANQFGDKDPVRVIGPDNPRRVFYYEDTGHDDADGFPINEIPFERTQFQIREKRTT